MGWPSEAVASLFFGTDRRR